MKRKELTKTFMMIENWQQNVVHLRLTPILLITTIVVFNLFNPFKPDFTIVIFLHYKLRIDCCRNISLVVDEDDLKCVKKKIAMYW